MLNKEEEITRKRGRQNVGWMDCMEGDLKRLGVVPWKKMTGGSS